MKTHIEKLKKLKNNLNNIARSLRVTKKEKKDNFFPLSVSLVLATKSVSSILNNSIILVSIRSNNAQLERDNYYNSNCSELPLFLFFSPSLTFLRTYKKKKTNLYSTHFTYHPSAIGEETRKDLVKWDEGRGTGSTDTWATV